VATAADLVWAWLWDDPGRGSRGERAQSVRIGRFYRRFVVIAGVAVVALVLALDAVHGARGLDLSSIDWRFAIRGSEGPSSRVMVVGIDDETFDHLGPREAHFPFRRRLDARVISNLRRDGAAVIAYDEQYTEPTDTTDDNDLVLAIRRAGHVVLATTEVAAGGKTRILGGGQGLAYSRATAAESQFPIDSDGLIRQMEPQILGLVTFPVAAAQLALHRRVTFPGGEGATAMIDYRGPTDTIQTVPYWRVLENRFTPGTFRGKIVVVGATEPILHDTHDTPTSVQMPGAEVQANAIDTVLRGLPLRPAPGWLNVVLVAALGLMAPLLAQRLDALAAGGVTLLAVGLLAVVCQLAFDSGTVVGFIYPALAAVLGALSTVLLQGVRTVFEREQVRLAFVRFVPESVVSEVLAQADGARLGGVRRHVTVLFSDLRGFTAFSEQREPDETLSVLNRYLSTMTDAIMAHGGTLVSYMGDGIMAVFGAPLDQPDHADRALAAAREMLERLASFNADLTTEGLGEGFKMGIGLNSGDVMSGNVGSERRLEYTTIGDTTNTASRIEGMTKGTPHQLFISDSTYRDLRVVPDDLIAAGTFPVRGRSEGVAIWRLADPASLP
jgi:adenylate cyclase